MFTVLDKNRFQSHGGWLADMYSLRHAIFVEKRGWEELRSPFRYEIDAYDNRLTQYLLGISGAQIFGSIRIYPSTANTMLSDHFAEHLLPGETLPSDPDVYEISRIFMTGSVRMIGDVKARLLLSMSYMDWAIANGATHLIGITEAHLAEGMDYYGWHWRPLSHEITYDGGRCIAIEITVDEARQKKAKAKIGAPAHNMMRERALPIPRPTWFDPQLVYMLSKYSLAFPDQSDGLANLIATSVASDAQSEAVERLQHTARQIMRDHPTLDFLHTPSEILHEAQVRDMQAAVH